MAQDSCTKQPPGVWESLYGTATTTQLTVYTPVTIYPSIREPGTLYFFGLSS